MPRLNTLLAAGILVGLVACTGRDDSVTPTAPTSPKPSAAISASETVVVAEVDSLDADAPPICKGTLARRNETKESVAEHPDDQDLKDSLEGLNAFLDENCR